MTKEQQKIKITRNAVINNDLYNFALTYLYENYIRIKIQLLALIIR